MRYLTIQNKIDELLVVVRDTWGITFPNLQVRFDIKNNDLGIAIRKQNQYIIRLNPRYIEDDDGFQEIMGDTIAHEIAHLVCFARPTLGRDHDYGWSQVCKFLGGDGLAYSQFDLGLPPSRKQKVWIYQLDGGDVEVSTTLHNRIQKGCSYYHGERVLNYKTPFKLKE